MTSILIVTILCRAATSLADPWSLFSPIERNRIYWMPQLSLLLFIPDVLPDGADAAYGFGGAGVAAGLAGVPVVVESGAASAPAPAAGAVSGLKSLVRITRRRWTSG